MKTSLIFDLTVIAALVASVCGAPYPMWVCGVLMAGGLVSAVLAGHFLAQMRNRRALFEAVYAALLVGTALHTICRAAPADRGAQVQNGGAQRPAAP